MAESGPFPLTLSLRIEHGDLLQDRESDNISITKMSDYKMQYTISKEINCSII